MAELHLALALEGAGWHPAAWREPDARPGELYQAGYWTDLVREAEAGALDLVTIEDSFAQATGRDSAARTDRVRGRLDATLIACRVAPLTRSIGLMPSTDVTHTEPFHVSKAIATLDYVSTGRAGWRPQVSPSRTIAAQFGRRTIPDDTAELFDEAAEHIDVVRRLWDSWEDDAEIRDVATGRFIDRHKLHYIDFEGAFFSVRGPSITPRPPQGQPVVGVLAHQDPVYRLGARAADIVYTTPSDVDDARRIAGEVRAAQDSAGRGAEQVHVFGDLVVFLGATAAADKGRLDELDGTEYASDAPVFTGTAAELADHLLALQEAGLTGFRLRPGRIPHDLTAITRELVPELRRRNAFRTQYRQDTLRGLLGLPRPDNRYPGESAA